jgi:hypothetical protein
MPPTLPSWTRKVLIPALVLCAPGLQAATFTVTSTADTIDADDLTTFREAVAAANADTDAESVIDFALGDGEHRISLASPLTFEQPTSVQGPTNGTLTIAQSSPLEIKGDASGTSFSNVLFDGGGGDDTDFLSLFGDVSIEGSRITGYDTLFSIISNSVTVNLSDSIVDGNNALMFVDVIGVGFGPPTPLYGSSINLQDCLLSGNERLFRVSHQPISFPGYFVISLTHSRIMDHASDFPLFWLVGAVELTLRDTTVDGNASSTFIAATPGTSFNPQITIIGSTLSGNGWSASEPFIEAPGNNFELRHSTLTNNSPDNNEALLNLTTPGGLVDHSVLNGNDGVALDLDGEGDINYSLVDGHASGFTVTNAITGPAQLGALDFQDSLTGYHLPDPLSPLVGGGDPALTAGSNSTPEADQRGSSRIINGVIDIGAVEFNRAPEVDVAALQTRFDDIGNDNGGSGNGPELDPGPIVINGLEDVYIDAGGSVSIYGFSDFGASFANISMMGGGQNDGTVYQNISARTATATKSSNAYLDMDDYVDDPDGDMVADIALLARPVFVFFDPTTHGLSGSRQAMTSGPFVFRLTDEHGLSKVTAVELTSSPETEESVGGSGSSSGSLGGGALLLLVLLGLWRRH